MKSIQELLENQRVNEYNHAVAKVLTQVNQSELSQLMDDLIEMAANDNNQPEGN